jgi:hypothetical protein
MNRSGTSQSGFKCPRCGCTEWGSYYNFDGPGDTPIDPKATGLDQGGRSTDYKGTLTRMCHGYVPAPGGGYRSCSYKWNSRDDLANGIEPLPPATATGYAPPKVPRAPRS